MYAKDSKKIVRCLFGYFRRYDCFDVFGLTQPPNQKVFTNQNSCFFQNKQLF